MSPHVATSIESRCRRCVALAGVIASATLAGCNGPARTESDADQEPAPSGDSQPATTKAGEAAERAPDPKYHLTLTLDVPDSIKASRLEKLPCDVTIRNHGEEFGDTVVMFGQALTKRILTEDERGNLLSDLNLPDGDELPRPGLNDAILIRRDSAVRYYDLRPLPLAKEAPGAGSSVYVYLEIDVVSPGAVESMYHHLIPLFEEDSIKIWKGPALQSEKKRVRLE